MKSFRCPTCNQWVWVADTTIDFVHKCHKTDGSAFTKRKKSYFPNQHIQRMFDNESDGEGWESKGLNPPSPDKQLTSKKIEKQIRGDKRQVYTYIRTGDS